MGIVVSVAMLLALVIMVSKALRESKKYRPIIIASIGFISLSGVWNSVWYGGQNVPSLWGITALISGVLMLIGATMVVLDFRESPLVSLSWYASLRQIVVVGLLLYFLFYTISIIQMNLGLPYLH